MDLGGGIGIISSELNSSNQRINADFSFEELQTYTKMVDPDILTVSSSITHIPFNDSTFDCVISASVIQYLRRKDISKNIVNKNQSYTLSVYRKMSK